MAVMFESVMRSQLCCAVLGFLGRTVLARLFSAICPQRLTRALAFKEDEDPPRNPKPVPNPKPGGAPMSGKKDARASDAPPSRARGDDATRGKAGRKAAAAARCEWALKLTVLWATNLPRMDRRALGRGGSKDRHALHDHDLLSILSA